MKLESIKYSVLMSVYCKENSENLMECVESIMNQTIRPSEIILIEDGPLTELLYDAIKEVQTKYPLIKTISFKENKGLGIALQHGIEYCSNELVMRMDTDDLVVPTRAEKQIDFLTKNNDISLVGGYVEEIFENNDVSYIKKVPLTDNEIKKSMKSTNPINHPTVLFRKSHILDAGSYQNLILNEDYYLWVRMAQKNYKFANLNQVLVKMRVSDDTYYRRGGYSYFKTQNLVYKYMKDNSMITNKEYLKGYIIRLVYRALIPPSFRKIISTNLLRKEV